MSNLTELGALKINAALKHDDAAVELLTGIIRSIRYGDRRGETDLLLDIIYGKYPGLWDAEGWEVTEICDGEEWQSAHPNDRAADLDWLCSSDQGGIRMEHEDGRSMGFALVFGNEPGVLISDGHYSRGALATWDRIANVHNLLTER